MFVKKLDPDFQESLNKMGLEKANDFQKKCISQIKSGADLIAISEPETGKTTSYMVALVQRLKVAEADVPRAMVLCSDKDRVIKLQEEFEKMGNHTDLRFHVGFDGANIQKQKDVIYFGTDIVIGTPRRICDLMSIEGINFAAIKTLVIDDGETIMKHTALSNTNRISESLMTAQKIIYTTQDSVNIQRYAGKFMKFPLVLENQ